MSSDSIRRTGVVASFVLALAAADFAVAQSTSRASVDSAGNEGNSISEDPSISADGRFVAFSSLATDLVSGDTNGRRDIFVYDRLTGATSRASVGSSGVEANGHCSSPSISANGRFVAFSGGASNLVPGDSNNAPDVFVHDRLTAVTSRVSVSSAGFQGEGLDPSISANGRYVAFSSRSADLVPGDANSKRDVFVHDRQTGETSRVSVDSSGVEADENCEEPSISGDGRTVAFWSLASTLDSGDTNDLADIYVHDRSTGETARTSVSSTGGDGNSGSFDPSISADGRYVAFQSEASNLVPGGASGILNVFVHDRAAGRTALVSVDSSGASGDSISFAAAVSADGRLVAYWSEAGNLVAGDTNDSRDVFLHDLVSGQTARVSVDTAGTQQGFSAGLALAISSDARFVAFDSDATNLVLGDTNGQRDVFVRDREGCRAGNVNAGQGAIADVLFVNGSTGGLDRVLRLESVLPLTVFMAVPPSAAGVAPFALFAWAVAPVPGVPPIELPFGIGATCLPTPLTGGSPAPSVVWNNTGSALAGTPTLPSSPAPSIVVRRERALGRPATVFLQGIIRDRGAPNGRAAVTNGVSIEIR